jgi:flagellar biosynthesis GTPase FlhF
VYAAQAIIDIAETFLVRLCSAARTLAEHRATGASVAAGTGVTPQSRVEVADFKLYLSQQAGLEVADFDEQRWLDTLAAKKADEEAARLAREQARAREQAAAAAAAAQMAEAKKQEELKKQQAAAEAKAQQATAAAAAAQAQQQANVAAATANSPSRPAPVAPATRPAFNAATQREMEAQARAGVTASLPRSEPAFPTKFLITCTTCKTLMQAPKVRPARTPLH